MKAPEYPQLIERGLNRLYLLAASITYLWLHAAEAGNWAMFVVYSLVICWIATEVRADWILRDDTPEPRPWEHLIN